VDELTLLQLSQRREGKPQLFRWRSRFTSRRAMTQLGNANKDEATSPSDKRHSTVPWFAAPSSSK
jgi:hypothetical protein